MTRLKLRRHLRLNRYFVERRVFRRFAESIGLVYFGRVDQRDDEHRLLRGITLSPTSRDDHYCIGTFRDYDIMLARRVDRMTPTGKSRRLYRWTIVAIDLRSRAGLPHVFIGHNSRRSEFMAKYTKLIPAYTGMFGIHSPAFREHFTIYARPDHALDVERMFRPELTAMMTEHFADTSIEITGGMLYIYSELRPSGALLGRMVTNGIWLAELLDTPGLVSAK